ncbi:MAG: hypothetical protein PHD92_04885 [Eubacteriales bacterium]|nr:hypothetical protein [Eubacteriales bacterium]
MSKITAYSNQTCFDLTLQTSGSLEAVFDLIALNPELRLDGQVAEAIEIRTPVVINQQIYEYYTHNAITPATGLAEAVTAGDGIGYWIINQDFIVQ